MYSQIRDLLFHFDPEKVHHFSMNSLQLACNIPFAKNVLQNNLSIHHPSLERNLFGLHFKNPIGLAAGFDKNAVYLNELDALGFGFVEVGTVTPLAQSGNDKPRLFRLPKDKAILNRMGFNNEGVKAMKTRLANWNNQKAKNKTSSQLIIGGNIGKNKITENENAWKDYEICFRELFDDVDYFVVNVSSPNTPNLRALQEKDALLKILGHLQNINQAQQKSKPLLLKIAPDLTIEQLQDIVSLSFEVKLDGLVATNTTISRDGLVTDKSLVENMGAGGISGKPVKQRSTDVVKFLVDNTEGKIPVIASGGIFNAADAKEKISAGASLLQVYTGFIYEGPAIAKNICKGLIETK